MKKTFVALVVLGAASVAIWRARPAFAAHAQQKCEAMMELMGGHRQPSQTTACTEGSCRGRRQATDTGKGRYWQPARRAGFRPGLASLLRRPGDGRREMEIRDDHIDTRF